MIAYLISFEGMWLGGTAVVIASCPSEAIKQLCKDNPEVDKHWRSSIEILESHSIDKAKTIYYWNGDY